MDLIEIKTAQGVVLELHLSRREISVGATCLALKKKPFRLMVLLAENIEQIVSRPRIYKEVWGYDFDPRTKVIEVQIHYLRRILISLGAVLQIKTYHLKGLSLQSLPLQPQ